MDHKRSNAFSITIIDPDNPTADDPVTGLYTINEKLYVFKKLGIYEVLLAEHIDPDTSAPETRNTYVKISSTGTKAPLVSRMIPQFDDMFNVLEGLLDQEINYKELRSHIWKSNRLLLECESSLFKIYSEAMALFPKCDEIIESNKNKHYIPSLPQITDMENLCISYFSNAKRFLVSAYGLLNFFFKVPAPLKYFKYLKWSEENLGLEHEITRMLRDDEKWVAVVAESRNAIEHPQKGASVELFNFRIRPGNKFSPPGWKYDLTAKDLGQSEELELVQSLNVYLENMLTFYEEILLLCIAHIPGFSEKMEIVKFRPEDIDKDCPKYYRIDLKRSFFDPDTLKRKTPELINHKSTFTKKISVQYKGYLHYKFGELPNTGNAVAKCYAGKLLSCNGSISKEHYISENILERFSGIKPEGIPWMAQRSELIGPNDLTAKCLCEKHNNYLHPLDTVAGGVFDAFHNFGTYQPIITNISGPLFERWCLKVLFGMLASKKVIVNNEVITPDYLGQDWLEVLYLGKSLPAGAGLYSYHLPGQKIDVETKVVLQTLILDEKLQGLKISIAGFEFYFSLIPKEIGFKKDHPNFDYILYRPSSFNKKPYPQEINFHWK